MDFKDDRKNFDFEHWRKLAARDPQAFESARRDAVMALIRAAPAKHRQRMQGLQWRIDSIRETTANPMAACLKLSGMMWDAVLGDEGLMHSLKALEGKAKAGPKPRQAAKVIPLVPGGKQD